MVSFSKATKRSAWLRLALAGPAGTGKTFTALTLGSCLAGLEGGRLALIDTEHGSASKYADRFDFDALELSSFHPERYIEAIDAAEHEGYAVLILDSLSHAWSGKDGALELVDRAAKRSQSGNKWAAWADVTPLQNALIERILSARVHIMATLRVKTEYIVEDNGKGKTAPKRVGLAPVQRDQVEYEFDVYGDLDYDHTLLVGKTRCSALAGGVIPKPGRQLAEQLYEWLRGEPVVITSDKHPLARDYDRLARLAIEAGIDPAAVEVHYPIGEAELIAKGRGVRHLVEQARAKKNGKVPAAALDQERFPGEAG